MAMVWILFNSVNDAMMETNKFSKLITSQEQLTHKEL